MQSHLFSNSENFEQTIANFPIHHPFSCFRVLYNFQSQKFLQRPLPIFFMIAHTVFAEPSFFETDYLRHFSTLQRLPSRNFPRASGDYFGKSMRGIEISKKPEVSKIPKDSARVIFSLTSGTDMTVSGWLHVEAGIQVLRSTRQFSFFF